jgi:hypothetical protein
MKMKMLAVGLCGLVGGALISLMLQQVIHFPRVVRGDGLGTAADWHSFSVSEREIYANGYTNGYNVGAQAVCDMTDQLFEIRGEVFLKNGTRSNQVELCHSSMDAFTRMSHTGTTRRDYSMYSNEITGFYTKYPKYKKVVFIYLFSLMSDKNHKTADQIFQEFEKNDM